jgi:hypothetical protein
MAKSECNKAVSSLMEWIRRESHWAARFDATLNAHSVAALDAGGLTQEELPEILGNAASGLLFGCAFEALTAQRFETAPHNIVDDYLKRRGWRDSVPSRHYMAALRDAIMSMYEVTGVSPGNWVEVRDLVRGGEPVRVFERSGSQQIVRWDRIGARVVDYQGQKVFTGAILPYRIEQSETLLRSIEKTIDDTFSAQNLKRASADPAEIRAAIDGVLATLPAAFTASWLAPNAVAQGTPLTDVVNSEGDPIMFAETRFVLREGAADEVILRLDAMKDLHRVDDSPPSWDWQGKIDPSRNAGNVVGKGFMLQSQSAETGEHVFGSLILADGALTLSNNSVARNERGIEMLKAALGDLAGNALTSLSDVQQALDRARESAPTKRNIRDEVPPDVAAAVMRQFFDKHYHAWVDAPIPALDGLSPKQAVRTKRGKDDVVALLKTMENMVARRCRESGQPPYDFGWLWQELGLATRRL